MISELSFPLSGKTIVLTRSQNQQAEARTLFESRGAKVLDLPALVIGPPDKWEPLDHALLEIEGFHWIIFSSINGVKGVEQRLKLIGKSLSSVSKGLKIAVIGKKTAQYLKTFGVIPDFVPPQFVADSLIDHFPVSVEGLRILIPRVQSGGRNILAEALCKLGGLVVQVPAYESKCPKDIPSETVIALENAKVDAIVFTSAKTAINTSKLLLSIFGDQWKKIILDVNIISIGPQTTISCKKEFDKVDQQAKQYDLDGLIEACIESFNI
ncbi:MULTISPECIES: uroporphyrinogen-III synthase [unclassified Prochlorococcus]|uniref:uroporphyrinogen-III synthase n=1 Tax=unclassified Prochlorococcus TaxID=2627481 RepID=UPI000533B622|nr:MULTISPECIES: uroporphyrinogen-III synthase [unclassified Prochlorococcus]KGG16823.1 Uroporphyrinogen-III synthase [Prochlorococcus sp. MIT 0602]KGG18203.1 Uroporphyrinogen-III synthase [Prochlorococcus sp. MIT 0603]